MKKYTFPLAFLFSLCGIILSVVSIIFQALKCILPATALSSTNQPQRFFVWIANVIIINVIIISAYIFGFIGSLSNIKRAVFLRIGMIILSLYTLYQIGVRLNNIRIINAYQSTFSAYLSVFDNAERFFGLIVSLLLYFSILLLTICKNKNTETKQ